MWPADKKKKIVSKWTYYFCPDEEQIFKCHLKRGWNNFLSGQVISLVFLLTRTSEIRSIFFFLSSSLKFEILTINLSPCEIVSKNFSWWIANSTSIKRGRVLQLLLWEEVFPFHYICGSEEWYNNRHYVTAKKLWVIPTWMLEVSTSWQQRKR